MRMCVLYLRDRSCQKVSRDNFGLDAASVVYKEEELNIDEKQIRRTLITEAMKKPTAIGTSEFCQHRHRKGGVGGSNVIESTSLFQKTKFRDTHKEKKALFKRQ